MSSYCASEATNADVVPIKIRWFDINLSQNLVLTAALCSVARGLLNSCGNVSYFMPFFRAINPTNVIAGYMIIFH